MPLVKKPFLTEEKLAANRRNGGQSQGAVTDEGKARIGAAQFRHGRYSKGKESTLCGLGEDQAEFGELLAGLREEFQPAGALQEKLVTRLARVLSLVDRYPSITAEDWKARERARKLLRNILTRQVEVCETERKVLLRESLAGPSPYELAAEVASPPAETLLMRRVQDGNLREVRRLTNLLLKIQRRKSPEAPDSSARAAVSYDVSENKST